MFRKRDFRPYVTASAKRKRAATTARKLAKQGQTLQPIRLESREIARTFWGKSWCKQLESYSDYATRLPRGRSYVRSGCVLDLQISPGTVEALVRGTRLYRVHVTIDPVPATAWKALKDECSRRVGSLMDLLQGKLSVPVMEAITRRETGLFPKASEIRFECSCPDWAGMCKHVAAALYGVGARLDQSPELLFLLRRADHLELVTDATESVTASVTADGSAVLAPGDLAQVFGIEMEAFPPPGPPPAGNGKGPERPAKNGRRSRTASSARRGAHKGAVKKRTPRTARRRQKGSRRQSGK